MGKTYKMCLKQHIGVAATPVVAKGDRVLRGQLLASPQGLGAHVHASFSGKVSEVTDAWIAIEADDTQQDSFVALPENADVAAMAQAAGIVGMGGAGFPSHVKLATDLQGRGVVIANGVECEPLLAHNIQQIIQAPQQLYDGMLLAMRATKAAKGILAIKAKNGKAADAFRQIIKPGDNIEVFELPDMYPMGEERAIIREVLGVLLTPEQLPSAADCVVMNVETLVRLYEAVHLRRPVISKHVTVVGAAGLGRESKVFWDVPLGTTVGELLEQAGGMPERHGEIVMGGPFTGKSVNLDAVIEKATGGIIVTMEFVREKRPMGLLVCACGAGEERLREIAAKMEAPVAGVRKCKQAKEGRGGILKCENPGNCPGQAEKIMELRKEGAQGLIVSNCSDCTNTVMCVAPKLKMPVYHATDHIMRTVGHALVRRLPIEA